MINLLPVDIKDEIFYARRNTKLRRWIIASLLALAGVVIIIIGGLVYMQQTIDSTSEQVGQAKSALETQKVGETRKRLEEISTNTKLTVQVLSREVLFSVLLKKIGFALPANTALKSLEIDKVQGGVQLNANAADFASGTQLQLNLQDPKNGVFEKADINSITCIEKKPVDPNASASDPSATNAVTKRLPCEVSLRALFSKDNAFMYIKPEVKK